MRIFIDITSDQSGNNFVPAAVMNVQAHDLGTTIQVSWDEFEVVNEERDGVVYKYVVEKKVNDGNWSHMFDFTEEDWATGFFFYDIERSEGNTYNYRIKAVTTLSKETDWSKVATIEIEEDEPTVPETIPFANISSERSFNYIHIFWTPAGDGGSSITAYAIQRVGTGVLANDLQDPEYIDITSSTDYFTYNVAAINSVGQGTWSNGISSNIISNLDWWRPVLTVVSSNRIDIAVNNAAEWGNKVIDHYWDIQRSTDQSNWTTIASNQTDVYQDDELEASTTYYYRIVMKNEHGSSSASNVRNATTQAESSEIVSPAQKELVTFSSSTFPSETCKYYKYLPEGYNEAANESLYCFIVLHGLGEFRDSISGTEADKDAGIWQNGPAKHIYNNDDLETIGIAPHVFICPQQPFGTNFNNTIPSDRWNFNYLAEIYNIAIGLEKVDPNKIIITGLSMGGMAAQRYASLNPDKVYKCLVIAPNWLNAVDEVFAHQVPLWVVHGQNDTTGGGFGVGTTQTKIRDINALEPTYPPKFTCPTGVGHNSWDKTYNGVGWTVEELTPDPIGGAGVDPIGNPDHNPYVWATTGDKTNIIA